MATLAEVRTAILFALDEADADWATSANVTRMVDRAYRAAWDIILAKYEDYAVSTKTFTISSGNSHTLIADTPSASQIARTSFYKLRMLQREMSDGKYHALESYSLEQASAVEDLGYMFLGDVVYIEPSEDAAADYRAWYIAIPTALSADGDVLVDPVAGAIEQHVIDEVCARLKVKDELDPGAHMALLARTEERISRMAQHRDAGRPRKVSDVRGTTLRFRTGRDLL